ncbi:MAG: hypothetical protein M1812_007285 [Candelaria pacifica]|nr:MAG: hypothetical protein M1812_007285 [Candelaria pacifica]
MALHSLLSFFVLVFSSLCATDLTTPPILPQSLTLRGKPGTTEILSDGLAFFGGRVGNPQCDISLGSPHKKSCQGALRAMEWQRVNAVNKGITKYITPAEMWAYQMADQVADQPEHENQAPKPTRRKPPNPFRWPRLALPRLYSCEDCAISVDFVDDNNGITDQADVNAVRQTALAIMNSCFKPAPGAAAFAYGFIGDRGSGGWQLAGLNQKILFSLHQIPYDYREGKVAGESQTHGTCIEPSIEDPTYISHFDQQGNNDQGGSGQGSSGQGSGHPGGSATTSPGEFSNSDWADIWGEYWELGPSQGCGGNNHNSCCGSGLGYVIAPGTRKDNSIWDVLLGVTWDVMKALGNVGVCTTVQIDDGFSA